MTKEKQDQFWGEIRQLQDDIGEKLVDNVILVITPDGGLEIRNGLSKKAIERINEIYKNINKAVSDKKNPQEASNIFHSIIKASVSKAATEKKEVKPKPKK